VFLRCAADLEEAENSVQGKVDKAYEWVSVFDGAAAAAAADFHRTGRVDGALWEFTAVFFTF